eukprot:6488296-Amphidinium_carterae.2
MRSNSRDPLLRPLWQELGPAAQDRRREGRVERRYQSLDFFEELFVKTSNFQLLRNISECLRDRCI